MVDLGLFYGKIKYGKILEHKTSWKVLKIFYQRYSNDDIGLTMIFSWQDQICFPSFTREEFIELVKGLGAKVKKKGSKINEYINIFAI